MSQWYALVDHEVVGPFTLDDGVYRRYMKEREEAFQKNEPNPWQVALYESPDGEWAISTVFLGLDHNWGAGPPQVFETMFFPEYEVYDRYATWDQAVEGHQAAVTERSLQQRESSSHDQDRGE